SCEAMFVAQVDEAPPPPPPPTEEVRERQEERPVRRRSARYEDEDEDEDEDDRPRRRRRRSSGSRAAAEAMVGPPSIALLIQGILGLIACLFVVGSSIIVAVTNENRRMREEDVGQLIGGVCIGSVCLVMCIFVILGAIKMRSLQSYGLAMAGSIMAMFI